MNRLHLVFSSLCLALGAAAGAVVDAGADGGVQARDLLVGELAGGRER